METASARILVVDDDPTVVAVLSEVLEDERYRVRSARDGAEALATIEEECPDLLITDIMMPRLSGLEVLERIRSREAPVGPHLPIILITAAPPRLALPPRTRLLPKPFDLASLLDLVAGMLDHPEA